MNTSKFIGKHDLHRNRTGVAMYWSDNANSADDPCWMPFHDDAHYLNTLRSRIKYEVRWFALTGNKLIAHDDGTVTHE